MVSNDVMQSAGIVPEDDLEEDPDQPNSDSPVEERLEVFEDFLDNLEIDGDEEGDNSAAKNN
jgi:hypothetical protein